LRLRGPYLRFSRNRRGCGTACSAGMPPSCTGIMAHRLLTRVPCARAFAGGHRAHTVASQLRGTLPLPLHRCVSLRLTPRYAQEFNRRFRHEMCAMLVRQKVDADAGDVIAAMLQLSRPHETRLQEDRSAPLAEAAITAVVAKAASKGVWHVHPASVPGEDTLGTLAGLGSGLTSSCVRRRAAAACCRHIRGACGCAFSVRRRA
jgi:hypothetical protein